MKKQEKRRRKIRQRKEDARLNRRITARLLGVDVSHQSTAKLARYMWMDVLLAARLSEVRKQTSTYTRGGER